MPPFTKSSPSSSPASTRWRRVTRLRSGGRCSGIRRCSSAATSRRACSRSRGSCGSRNQTSRRCWRRRGADTFSPMAGKATKGWGRLPIDVVADDASLDVWLDRAFAFAASLPAKG